MPIPANQMTHFEVIKTGSVSAAGSNSKSSQSVWSFRRTTFSVPVNKTNLLTAFHSNVGSLIYSALNVRYTEQNDSARCLNDPTDPLTLQSHAHAGSIAGDSMALTVSAYLKFNTALRGKFYRGSKRLYPLSESDSTIATDDELNAAALARFAAICAAYLAGFTDSDGNVWKACIVSKTLTKTLATLPLVVYADVISTAVRKTMGHMRHRQVRSIY